MNKQTHSLTSSCFRGRMYDTFTYIVRCANYNIAEAEQLCTELTAKAVLLLQLLTSMRQKVEGGNHLAQLLLRLDFNRYFSVNKKITETSRRDI